MKKIILMCMILGFCSLSSQTVNDSLNTETNEKKWSFTSLLEVKTINFISDHDNENERSYISDISSLRIGALYNFKKILSEINFGVGGIEGMIKYKLPKNKFVKFSAKSLRFNDQYDIPYYDANIQKIRFNEYLGSFGVDFPLNDSDKLELSISSARISSNQYESYEFDNEQNKVIRIKRNATLNPTMIYGGGLRFDSKSDHWYLFNRNFNYYLSISYFFNPKSNYKRSVEIEEWLPGNLVYSEKTDGINYKINTLSFKIGVYW